MPDHLFVRGGILRNGISRRGLLGGGAGLIAAPFVSRPAFAADKITVADPGGVYVTGFTPAFYAPFRKTGVELVNVSRDAEPTSQVKAQVEAKSYIWDVVSITLSSRKLLSDAGLLIVVSSPNFLPKSPPQAAGHHVNLGAVQI